MNETFKNKLTRALAESFNQFGGMTRTMTTADIQQHFGFRHFSTNHLNLLIMSEFKPSREPNPVTYSFPIDFAGDPDNPLEPIMVRAKGRPWIFHKENFEILNERSTFPNISAFLKHLFQEYYDNEMILDYLTIIATKPEQKLPILCLKSDWNMSGKSTFISLINMLFETSLIPENDLHQDFNAHWIKSRVIAIDEFSKRKSYEKIKFLATTKKVMYNEKMKQSQLIDFNAKFIILSNVEQPIDSSFWVVKLKRVEVPNYELHGLLVQDAPAFIKFITNREIKYQESDRLWFKPEDFMKVPATVEGPVTTKEDLLLAYDAGLQDGYHNLGVSHFEDWYKEYLELKNL